MKKVCEIRYWTDNLHLSYPRDLPGGGFDMVVVTDKNYKKCAKELHCDPELLSMLLRLVCDIKLSCRREFEQIYRELHRKEDEFEKSEQYKRNAAFGAKVRASITPMASFISQEYRPDAYKYASELQNEGHEGIAKLIRAILDALEGEQGAASDSD